MDSIEGVKKTKNFKCFETYCSYTADRIQRISSHHIKYHSVANFSDSTSIKTESNQ